MKIYNDTTKLLLASSLLVILSLSSCIKDTNSGNEVNGLTPVVLIPEGGMANFSAVSLSYPSSDIVDTAFFHVNYAATQVAPKDVTVNIGFDSTAMVNYNATSNVKYSKFPDSIYSFKSNSVTVKAGQNYSSLIPLVLYPSKIDPTQNYMLPISVLNGQGNTISGNFGTIYYHLIGNPIAGAHSEEWIRWNNADGSGAPRYDLNFSNVFSSNSPTEVTVQSAGNGLLFIIDFTNNAGVLSNFTCTIDPNSYGNAGLASLINAPTITVSPDYKTFTINFSYTNTSGAGRNIVEKFIKM
jgi:Domain of unknown function (DUF1735)